MIPIQYCRKDSEERSRNAIKFYEKVISHRSTSYIKQLDNWCKKYLSTKDKIYQFKDVIIADPDELLQIKKLLDLRTDYNTIKKELSHVTKKKSESYYVVDQLYSDMRPDTRMFLLDKLDATVCPYCNRSFVYAAEGFASCQLDHFFSKSKYPIFAVSFYNLIPVCGFCNHKKGEEEFDFYPHNLNSGVDDILKFSFALKGTNFLKDKNDIDIIIKSKNIYNNQIEKLGLRELYSKHRDIVREIIQKFVLNSSAYIESLYKENRDIFTSQEEVEEMIYSAYLQDMNLGERPLSKLTRDILMELKWIIEFYSK